MTPGLHHRATGTGCFALSSLVNVQLPSGPQVGTTVQQCCSRCFAQGNCFEVDLRVGTPGQGIRQWYAIGVLSQDPLEQVSCASRSSCR